jgi:regulator of protease activity HflC (stomatin/prohibitin superfamily)
MVESVNLVDIDFTPEFNKVVEEKQIEEQKIRTAQYVRMQAEENKKTEILKAEAEATKQRLLQQSATREVVNLKWIEKWNGVLPQVNAGKDTMLIVNPGSASQ